MCKQNMHNVLNINIFDMSLHRILSMLYLVWTIRLEVGSPIGDRAFAIDIWDTFRIVFRFTLVNAEK